MSMYDMSMGTLHRKQTLALWKTLCRHFPFLTDTFILARRPRCDISPKPEFLLIQLQGTQKRCPPMCLGYPTIFQQVTVTQVTPYISQRKFSPTLSLIVVYTINLIQLFNEEWMNADQNVTALQNETPSVGVQNYNRSYSDKIVTSK